VKVHGLSHATWIAASDDFTCALRSSGAVLCWGYNDDGELGNGTTTHARTPVQVIGVAHATALSASYDTGCAVVSGGSVRCWGYGGDGELGNGTTSDSHTATPVDGLSGVSALSGGGQFNCAVVRSQVFCWGDNAVGEIGANLPAIWALTPTAVATLGAINALSTGYYHSVVRLTSGGLRAWGYNSNGQLGNGTTTNSPLPVPVSG
jgi:alpha-tubulin suppressor-like RCC1 family protein